MLPEDLVVISLSYRKIRNVASCFEEEHHFEVLKVKHADELYNLLANLDKIKSELMSKALNNLKYFWNKIFIYRNDEDHSIDNITAERTIRPSLSNE